MNIKRIMEPLSSFAISYAAGVALDFYNQSQSTVNIEIKKAFKKALKKWCINPIIRNKRKNNLQVFVGKIIQNPSQITDLLSENAEYSSFFEVYKIILAQYQSAYNYIKEIKDHERFNELRSQLIIIDEKLQDLNDGISYIKNNLPKSSKEIEAEWKRQLVVYRENITAFKPKTALNLLCKLEESFISNEEKPSSSILASLELLKGECYGLIGNSQEMCRCYVKAYTQDSQTLIIKEKACFAYAKMEEFEKANGLIQEILNIDEFNAMAWAVKIFSSNHETLDDLLSKTPKSVINNLDFKRILYFNTIQNKQFNNPFDIFEKYDFFVNLDFSAKEITLLNYKDELFVIEVVLTKLLGNPYIEFNRINHDNIEDFQKANIVLENFVKRIMSTEIYNNFKTVELCYWYTDFVLNEKSESVFKMKALYNDIDKNNLSLIMILANSLQQIGEYGEAIKIIDEQKNKFIQLLHLKAFCLLKTSQIDEYIQVSKEIINSFKIIDVDNCESVLNTTMILKTYSRLEEVNIPDLIKEKAFEFEFLKQLIILFFDILNKNASNHEFDSLLSIENDVLKTNSNLNFFVPYAYFIAEKYDFANSAFEKYVSKERESRDLLFYILSLYQSRTKHKELFELLGFWRENFSFNEDLLRIEAELCYELAAWEQALSISEYYLNKHESDEFFLTLKLLSLNELEITDERIRDLAKSFENFQFSYYGHARNVCKVLFEHGFFSIALDITYHAAKQSGNKQARMDYFFAIMNTPDGMIKEPETVEFGCHVKYSIKNEVKYVEIVAENSFSESFLGHKKGDIIIKQRPLLSTIDSIEIIRIMDKYLCLHDEILEEVHSNPYSGLPMQSVEFKGVSVQSINDTLVELFGMKGTQIKKEIDDAYKKYYDYKMTFSELIAQNYSSQYIAGYYNLINSKDGITQIPIAYYPQDLSLDDKEFIIDYSSLLILYQISNKHGIIFKHKFMIAKGVVDYIRTLFKNEKLDQKEKMYIDVTSSGVTPTIITEEFVQNNLLYLEKLIIWINENCQEVIVVRKLDITRKIEDNRAKNDFVSFVIENTSLAIENENRILITDDSIYLKMLPLPSKKTISSEIYIKSHFEIENTLLFEFVRNKYVGFTISLNTLNQEFDKKIKGQPNLYSHCLNNCSLGLSNSQLSIQTIVLFLKQQSMNSLITEGVFSQEATNAFVILLKGQRDATIFKNVEHIIRCEFELLGPKLYNILSAFSASLAILNFKQ